MEKKPITIDIAQQNEFIAVNDLKSLVDQWLQRETGSEEIDNLISRGGEKWLENGLVTSVTKGIDPSTIPKRTEIYGTNHVAKVEMGSYWDHCVDALEDLLLRVLIVAGIADIIINAVHHQPEDASIFWLEGVAIIVTVLLVVNITAYINYKKERQFNTLNEESEANKTITVIRGGVSIEGIKMEEVYVGDLVVIKSGMEIAGDGVVVEGFSLMLDESSMTGETKPMSKETILSCEEKKLKLIKQKGIEKLGHHEVPSPVILSGTKVKNGNGKMLVINVGPNSAIGKIKEIMTSGEDEMTPLQLKLEHIAQMIGYFGLYSAILIVLVLFIRYIIEMSTGGEGNNWASQSAATHLLQFLHFVLVGIAILVVAIPEGLPMAVTLSLAFSIRQMMNDNNLVRKMAACETMGGANIICSDKTGTLTRNEMYWTHFWNFDEKLVFNSEEDKPIKYNEFVHKDYLNVFLDTILVNSLDNPHDKNGNPTELALLRYLDICGVDVVVRRDQAKKLFGVPFSSDRKRMSTVAQMKDGRVFVFIKGASEYILKLVKDFNHLSEGTIEPMTNEIIAKAEKGIESMATKALRTIGLAYKEISMMTDYGEPDEAGIYEFEKSGFTFLGIAGIKDIIRPEVPLSVKKCHSAGIDVKMVTGDNKITARAIAKEVNIINEFNEHRAIVLEGPDFLRRIGGVCCANCREKEKCDCVKNEKELSLPENSGKQIRKDTIKNQEEFEKIWRNLVVLARSRPEDKYALVVGLKERDNVVAVTGDGTNDAPALSKADVGFAMGIAGTEVAKEAASIIILDDNFASIVLAARWGRNIYDSIKKFLQFQLTVNVVAVFTTLVSAAVTKDPIFSTVQMLWINIIMDTLAALALPTEPPTDELLKRKPHQRNDLLLSPIMIKKIIGQSIYQLIILLIFFFLGERFLVDVIGKRQLQPNSNLIVCGRTSCGYNKLLWDNQYSLHYTYNFNVFVMMTLFNFFNARMLDNSFNVFKRILDSHLLILILCIIMVLQILFLTFAGPLIRVTFLGLDVIGWLICFAFGAFGVFIGFILNLIPAERLFSGFGNKEITVEEMNKMNVISVKKSHNSAYFRKNSVFNRQRSIIEDKTIKTPR